MSGFGISFVGAIFLVVLVSVIGLVSGVEADLKNQA